MRPSPNYFGYLFLKDFCDLLADPPECGASYSNGPCCPSVCLSARPSVCVSQTNISVTKPDRRMVTIGNSNRKLGFPIQNLPSDSRSEVRFRHVGYFRVGTSTVETKFWTWVSEWFSGYSHRSVCHLAEFFYDHTYKLWAGGPAIVSSHRGRHLLCVLCIRAFQFGQKNFDSIRFGNLINLPLVHT